MNRPDIEIPKVVDKAPDADRFTLFKTPGWVMVLDTDVLDPEGRATVLVEGPSLMAIVRGFMNLSNEAARLESKVEPLPDRFEAHIEQALVEQEVGDVPPFVVAWSILDHGTGRTISSLDNATYALGAELVKLANKGHRAGEG